MLALSVQFAQRRDCKLTLDRTALMLEIARVPPEASFTHNALDQRPANLGTSGKFYESLKMQILLLPVYC
jgi:hypothetical protein